MDRGSLCRTQPVRPPGLQPTDSVPSGLGSRPVWLGSSRIRPNQTRSVPSKLGKYIVDTWKGQPRRDVTPILGIVPSCSRHDRHSMGVVLHPGSSSPMAVINTHPWKLWKLTSPSSRYSEFPASTSALNHPILRLPSHPKSCPT